ncbi:hypothetical protein LY76DRAFT_599076 [Colletotrichum caudatum]|nr:hypothetical protein LY76DRAFT_599076 [Colletotrichum caudatum]
MSAALAAPGAGPTLLREVYAELGVPVSYWNYTSPSLESRHRAAGRGAAVVVVDDIPVVGGVDLVVGVIQRFNVDVVVFFVFVFVSVIGGGGHIGGHTFWEWRAERRFVGGGVGLGVRLAVLTGRGGARAVDGELDTGDGSGDCSYIWVLGQEQ